MKENTIIEEYRALLPKYEQLEALVLEKIRTCVREHHFFVMDVAHRIKAEDSLRGKLERFRDRFSSVQDFTDILGLRVICYFNEDIDPVAEAVAKLFRVLEIRDKRVGDNIKEFGYASLHYICALKEEDGDDTLCGIRFEIQIRTVLQHAWAEIEHDLGYKSEFTLSTPIRRDFSRMAGLLEIADNQFADLRKKATEYTALVHASIREDRADALPLDHVSLNEYIRSSAFMTRYFAELAEALHIEIEITDCAACLERLQWLGVKTLGDFKALLLRNQTQARQYLQEQVEKFELDLFTFNAVLDAFTDAELVASEEPEARLAAYYALGKSDPAKIQNRVARILERRAAQ